MGRSEGGVSPERQRQRQRHPPAAPALRRAQRSVKAPRYSERAPQKGEWRGGAGRGSAAARGLGRGGAAARGAVARRR